MKYIIYFLLALASLEASAQIQISGIIKDEKGDVLPFATIYIDETFEGGSSDIDGKYYFDTKFSGALTLVSSAVGFETIKQTIVAEGAPLVVDFTLKSVSQVLNPVVISAGSFDASDKAKSTMLEPLDIVMNAGAQGDIFKAIETLPGVSKVGNETGLFVRGGDAHETRTIIDGTVVQKPFFSETPHISSRSRFDPFMFKGTTFTTGGYSSEYGGALSSVLLLETQDLPENSMSSLGVNMAGITLSHRQVWKEKTALIGSFSYNNLVLLFRSVPQNVDWKKEPEGFGTNWGFRHKTKRGMFKSTVQHQQARIGIYTSNLEQPQNPNLFTNNNSTTYINTNYKGTLSDKWGIYAGLAVNDFSDKSSFNQRAFDVKNRMIHGKTTLYYDPSQAFALKFGAESFIEEDQKTRWDSKKMNDQYSALFTESDISLGYRWAIRLGLRSEYSHELGKMNLAPRTSMAYKTGSNSQVSLAYGQFYQKPEDDFMFWNRNLDYEKSSHLIANYQWTFNERSFRFEIYDKRYSSLVKQNLESALDNNGKGFSRGIDIFWKDDKSIDNLDYWVSYSYIDAQRNYKDYQTMATPTFVTDHTLNVVANYEIEHLGLRPGMTYTFASGRRYFNPHNPDFLSDKTIDYHNLTMNLSYVTQLFNKLSVIYASLSNPLGFDQVYGYNYSADGSNREVVGPPAKTTFFLGFFVNF